MIPSLRFTRWAPLATPKHLETLTVVRLGSDQSLAVRIEAGTPESWADLVAMISETRDLADG
jgi:hypothetical protein